jgi:uncharacterized membrane protein YgcG
MFQIKSAPKGAAFPNGQKGFVAIFPGEKPQNLESLFGPQKITIEQNPDIFSALLFTIHNYRQQFPCRQHHQDKDFVLSGLTIITRAMKTSLRILLVAVLLVRGTHAQTTATTEADDTAAASAQQQQPRKLNNKAPPAWIKEKFPNPQIVPEECRTTSNRLCDPDGIMIDMERQRLLQRIEQLETKHSIACKGADAENKHEVQMSVALANRMNLLSYGTQDRSEEAAQHFAVHLHNQWGVGVDTNACGSTGMLLFFSIRDRAFYLSRGKALEHILSDARVDRIMENQVKPLLRQERYSEALLKLIDGLDHYLDRGPPTTSEVRQEWLEKLLPLSFVAVIVGMMGWQMRNELHETQAYANVESQLSQLDRDRAEALQGRYQCKSCPICLENFQTEAQAEAETTGGTVIGGSSTDGAPTVAAPTADGVPEDGDAPATDGAATDETVNDQPLTKGSDGLPLKLLRCGHVFDETCWSEWVSSGSGNLRRCPICQQDVGGNNTEGDAATAQPQQQQRQQAADNVDTNNVADNYAENRVFRRFHRERNFRLARLGMRFPHYIGRQQLNTWTQSNYDGTLARDPGFVRNNPRVIRQMRQSSMGRRGGGSSFGGGSSGGGRGGSW